MGGVTAAIAGGARAGAAEIRKTAEETNKSFKSMKDNFKTLVDAQDREVRRMEGIFGRFRRMFGGNQAGGNMSGPISATGGGAPGVSNPPNAPRPGQGGGGAGGGGGGGGSGAPWYSVSAGGMFNGTGKSWIPGGQTGMMAGFAGAAGLPTGMLSPAGAVQSGLKLGMAAVSASNDNQLANLNQTLSLPMVAANARAKIGDAMGQNALAMRHGDIARAHALRALESDPNYKQMMGQTDLLEFKRQKEHPTDAINALSGGRGSDYLKGKVGSFFGGSLAGSSYATTEQSTFERGMNRFKSGASRVGHAIFGGEATDYVAQGDAGYRGAAPGTGIGTKSTMQVEQENARNSELAMQVERRQEMLNAHMREDPEYNERMNNQFARSNADSSLMRGLGMSGRDMRVAGKGSPMITASQKIQSLAEVQGRDVSEFTGAFASLAAGGRGFGKNYMGILGAQTGGLYNAAGIQTGGAQFGGYGGLLGRGGKSGIQGMIGGGGLDVTAGAQLAGGGLSAMMSGNFLAGSGGIGGSGLMETMMTAAMGGGGATTGGQMRVARELQQSQGFADREAAGGLDNLNKALNMRAAMKASPEAPWAIRNMLTTLSEPQLNDIMKGGPMPDALIANGVTKEMVQKYYAAKNTTMFARFGTSKEYGTDAQRSEVGKYRAAGGIGYLKGKSPAEVEKALNILAGAGAAGGGSIIDHLGVLRKQAAVVGVYGKPHGKGAGDVLADSTNIAASNTARAIETNVSGQKEAAEGSAFRDDTGHLAEAHAAENIGRRHAQSGLGSGKDVATAITTVTAALTNLGAALTAMTASVPAPKGGGKRAAGAGG
jgi:hypothetical protein